MKAYRGSGVLAPLIVTESATLLSCSGRFTPGEIYLVSIELESVWALEPVFTRKEKRKYFAPIVIRTPDCPVHKKSENFLIG